MEHKSATQVIWFGGREFRKTTWRDMPGDPGRVILVFAVTRHISPWAFRGILTGRHVL